MSFYERVQEAGNAQKAGDAQEAGNAQEAGDAQEAGHAQEAGDAQGCYMPYRVAVPGGSICCSLGTLHLGWWRNRLAKSLVAASGLTRHPDLKCPSVPVPVSGRTWTRPRLQARWGGSEEGVLSHSVLRDCKNHVWQLAPGSACFRAPGGNP